MWDPPAGHPLVRMFAGITEQTFITTLGVADPPLVDYLSRLLSRFIHADEIFRLRNSQGQRLTELSQMAAEADKLPLAGRTRLEYHRHVGDFALFWSGFFPEAVNRMQTSLSKDHRAAFALFGRRSYGIAAEAEPQEAGTDTTIFCRLRDEFELCAYGLNEVRREFDELSKQGPQGNVVISR